MGSVVNTSPCHIAQLISSSPAQKAKFSFTSAGVMCRSGTNFVSLFLIFIKLLPDITATITFSTLRYYFTNLYGVCGCIKMCIFLTWQNSLFSRIIRCIIFLKVNILLGKDLVKYNNST